MKKNKKMDDDGAIRLIRKGFLIMRLFLIFMVLGILQSTASVYSQNKRFSLNEENISIREVIELIEDQSEYRFFYEEAKLNINEKLNLDVENSTIKEVLDELFKQKSIVYKIMENNFIVLKSSKSSFDSTQQKNVTGVVTDSSGQPLPGVSIVIKGTTIGTITNFDGNFNLTNVSDEATLVFSFVGMIAQEIAVKEQSNFNIVMEEASIGVDEVIVVGYGTQKKATLTSAVEMVDVKTLDNRPVSSLSEMLSGTVANLNVTKTTSAPGSSPSLNIRGFTGIGDSDGHQMGSPLIMVDGVEHDINFINPNDIESVSVLKDAAASAIYGTRAPNGVILITTKSGKKGQKMTINYSGDVRVSTPIGMPEILNSYDYATLINNGRYNNLLSQLYSDDALERMQQFINGEITDNNIIINGAFGDIYESNANEDYFSTVYKDLVVNHSHNVSINGGSEKSTYYVGVGYLQNDGIYQSDIDSDVKKFVNAKFSTDINSWLKVGLNTKYTREELIRPNIGTYGANDGALVYYITKPPNIPHINQVGDISEYHRNSILPSLKGDAGYRQNTDNFLLTTFSGEITPLKGLSIKGNYTWRISDEDIEQTNFVYKTFEADGTETINTSSPTSDYIKKQANHSEYQTVDLIATYTKSIKKHNFNALIGYQHEYSETNNIWASNTDMYTTLLPSLSLTYGDNTIVDDEVSSWATQGYFMRFGYDYAGKYMVEFNGRRDAASKYSPETRWATFPSVSAGYNIAKENFWPLKDHVNMFKLKGSWGRLGNGAGAGYAYLATMTTGSQASIIIDGSRPPEVHMPDIISSDLTWIKPETLGFGIDILAFDSRLSFEYNWYQKTIRDQEGPAETLPESLGVNPPSSNNSVSETRGWELTTSWRDEAFKLKGSPFNYGIKLTMSDYIGYVVEYNHDNMGLRNSWTPGQMFGEIYGWESAGIVQSVEDIQGASPHMHQVNNWIYPGSLMWVDRDGDGLVSNYNHWYNLGDSYVLGYDYPRYKYSIALNFNWKGFSLYTLFDGVGKQTLYSNSEYTTGLTGSGVHFNFQKELGYWSSDNTDAFFPRIIETGKTNFANNQYALNLAHLRFKNINLSYNLPKSVFKSNTIDYLTINFSVENVGMVYYKSWSKLDPEFLQNEKYPPSRTFSLGLKFGIK